MLTGLYVSSRLPTQSISQHQIKLTLSCMPLERPTICGPSTFSAQMALSTDPRRGLILIMAPLLVIVSPAKDLPRRTDVPVTFSIIEEGFPGKDIPLAARTPLYLPQGWNVGLYAQIMTEKKIINLAISAVGYYRINAAAGVLLVDIYHLPQKIPLIVRARCDPGSSGYLVLRIHCPVVL